MNTLDIVLLVFLAIGAIKGFSRGFFVELASIVSLVVGLWAALYFSETVQGWLRPYIHWNQNAMRVISFLLIFCFVVIVVHLVATLTEKFVKAIALSFFSRITGAVLGALKMAFILSLLIYVVDKLEPLTGIQIPSNLRENSKIYPPIRQMAPNIFPLIEQEKEELFHLPKKNIS